MGVKEAYNKILKEYEDKAFLWTYSDRRDMKYLNEMHAFSKALTILIKECPEVKEEE